jgi:ATP-binding cassette subfamily B multidrug efflux pump
MTMRPPPGRTGGRPAVGPMGGRGPMGHGPMAAMGGEKARHFKDTMITLVKYLRPYRTSLVLVLGVMAKLMQVPGAAIDFPAILRLVLTLLGLYVVSAGCNYLQGYIMSGVAMKVTYELRKNIAEKIDRLPLKYFDTRTHGEVLSRVTNDVDTINLTLTQNLSQIVTAVVTLIGVLVMMLTISWLMTLGALVILPLSMMLIRMVISRSQKYFRRQQDWLGHVNGHVEEMYAGHNIMKAFNGEERSVLKFDAMNNELYDSAWKSQFLSGAMMPIMTFVGNLGYILVSILGGYLTVIKVIQVGDILAFIQYVRLFNQPIMQTANIANVLQSTAAAAERVFEFLAEEEITPETPGAVRPEKVSGAVTFDHVRFGYNPDVPVIKDFSADIRAGQKVAIVGPTGAGKTTLVKLLMRFYEIDSGSIRVDGVDIREFRRQDLRGIFGMVLQDTWLFNGTIRDNLRYGNFRASDEEVIAAAKMAYVDHFVHTLPRGYEMELNEESSNISQGQKQLLTIARAFLANPRVLILDEATSSVDTRTEVLIQKAMEQLMEDRTSFVIAHRLSTIRDADLILVMNEGDIVEQGTHTELLAAGGFYASLYRSQFEMPTAEALDVGSQLA